MIINFLDNHKHVIDRAQRISRSTQKTEEKSKRREH